MLYRKGARILAAAAILLSGCDDAVSPETELTSTPAQMVIVSGNEQTASPGRELPEPIVVRVLNASGNPISNRVVNFRVVAGGGTVFAGVGQTNGNGIVQERWTLGPEAGEQRLEARSVHNVTGEKLVYAVFTAIAGTPPEPAAKVTVTPASGTINVRDTLKLTAAVEDAAGNPQPGAAVSWVSADPSFATVDSTGRVTGVAAGRVKITATSGQASGSADITVAATSPPPPPPSGEFVTYPTEAVAFVAGPQLRSGSASNPWPWFDENALTKGFQHGSNFPASPTNTDDYLLANYYDQGLAQYINYYRTGDVRFRDYARKIVDSWWRSRWIASGTADPGEMAPREISMGGLILRAMDGRPEMWPYILRHTRYHYDIWLGMRLNNDELHYGVRDGGYALWHVALLAKVHPDPGVRSEMLDKGLRAARDYLARLQYPDGSWRWTEVPGNGATPHEQPFMIGMMLEGMIAVHQLTNDGAVRQAILRGVEHLYAKAYRTDSFTSYGGGKWRGMWYTLFGSRCDPPVAGACGEGEPMPYSDKIREVRQLNPMTLHAFGYAYLLSGDVKYRNWGDEVFAATFGKGRGPLADSWYGLADYRPREYNQSYRTAGRYLAWRLGG